MRPFITVNPRKESTSRAFTDLIKMAVQYKDVNPIFVGPYGFMRKDVHEWVKDCDPIEISLARDSGYTVDVGSGFKITIKLYTPTTDPTDIRGGYFELWYKTLYIKVYDVYSFFGARPLDELHAAYHTTDLAEIMERTRKSLESVGLSSARQWWHRASSVIDSIWTKDIDESVEDMKGEYEIKGGYIGCEWVGHEEGDFYYYDINGAYLYQLWKFEHNGERPFKKIADHLWSAKVELGSDPATMVIKQAYTTIVGRFATEYNDLWKLAQQIYDGTTYQLKHAMKKAKNKGGRIIRYYIDGFITDVDINEDIDIGTGLGQWKVEHSNFITSIDAGTYWIDGKSAHRGLRAGSMTHEQVLDHLESKGFAPIKVAELAFDPYSLKHKIHKMTFDFEKHYDRQCKTCKLESQGLHRLTEIVPK